MQMHTKLNKETIVIFFLMFVLIAIWFNVLGFHKLLFFHEKDKKI